VEAITTQTPVLPPGTRERVRGSLGRHAGVERGVKTGDLRQVGPHRPHHIYRSEGLRIVQRGEVDESTESLLDRFVDENWCGEARAAVNNAVPDGPDLRHPPEERPESTGEGRRSKARKITRRDDLVPVIDDAELQAARAGVDDEHEHQHTMPDRFVRYGETVTTDGTP